MYVFELVADALHTTYHPYGEPRGTATQELALRPPDDVISLSHWMYVRRDSHPRRLDDVVGYWTETYIFGRVVEFDPAGR